MFQKGDKNITGDVKIDGKTDRLEDVLDPFRCTPLGESQNCLLYTSDAADD